MLLTAAGGQCIRFPVADVRVFQGRTSMGVRGIALGKDDKVISLSILRHIEATRRRARGLSARANAVRRGGAEDEGATEPEEASGAIELGEQRYVEMSAAEQFVLTISENGYGKRTSSFEYRTTGRGGKGIVAMSVNERNGKLVASFPVEESDQIMLVTDGGQLIRCPVDGIRIAGRSTQGVIVFDTAEGERVVSVERMGEEGENGNGEAVCLCASFSPPRGGCVRSLLPHSCFGNAHAPSQSSAGGLKSRKSPIRPQQGAMTVPSPGTVCSDFAEQTSSRRPSGARDRQPGLRRRAPAAATGPASDRPSGP